MTPIQTKFNRRQYRSRLEARYAVLFQSCRLAFDYEREGFELDVGRYLADFWLPSLRLFFEVKGSLAPSPLDKEKCQCLANESQRRVVIACGDLGWETLAFLFAPDWSSVGVQPFPEFLMQWISPELVYPAIEAAQSARFEFGETPKPIPLRVINQ